MGSNANAATLLEFLLKIVFSTVWAFHLIVK